MPCICPGGVRAAVSGVRLYMGNLSADESNSGIFRRRPLSFAAVAWEFTVTVVCWSRGSAADHAKTARLPGCTAGQGRQSLRTLRRS